jgi:hypothetical protein
MLVIPTVATPSQTLTVVLAGQQTMLDLYQRSTGFFCDVYVNDVLIIGGVICQNGNRIVRDAYLGFIGDFAFYDTQATLGTNGVLDGADPTYQGLNTQFLLIYLEQSDLAALGLSG